MKLEHLLIGLLLANILFMGFVLEGKANGCKSCKMYEYHLNFTKGELSKDGVKGYYDYGNYFCIWIKERSLSSIERTERHEWSHDFVFNDYNHFCIEPKRKNENRTT
ncbi:hypothetical protein LCGC14_1686560 [marine sediment metagenome]|uniref:Uncharacterized protein n=1 Tax=marine sediment metagenome TaxID=412755 RepID=A0A0F9KM38_9ZZZZ